MHLMTEVWKTIAHNPVIRLLLGKSQRELLCAFQLTAVIIHTVDDPSLEDYCA